MGDELPVVPPVNLAFVSSEALVDEIIDRHEECIIIGLRQPTQDDQEGAFSFTCSHNFDKLARMCAIAHAQLWALTNGLTPQDLEGELPDDLD